MIPEKGKIWSYYLGKTAIDLPHTLHGTRRCHNSAEKVTLSLKSVKSVCASADEGDKFLLMSILLHCIHLSVF